MTTYNLEQTPDVFIAPHLNNKTVYQMVHFSELANYKVIGDINLKKDKLIIHGTEIKEHVLQKLYDSLRFMPKGEIKTIYVNCNGACNIWAAKEGFHRTHYNVIFDWSPFGVIVPNSANDILRKELQQKDKEVAAMTSKKDREIEELKEQLSSCRKDRDLELQKVRNQLSSKEFQLKSTKIELESLMKDIKELECKLSSTRKENHDIVRELEKVENELSSCKFELELSNSQLESSNKKIIQLDEQLSSCAKEGEAKEAELIKVQDQLSMMNNDQLQSMKILLEFTEAKEDKSLGEYIVNKRVEIVDE